MAVSLAAALTCSLKTYLASTWHTVLITLAPPLAINLVCNHT